MKVFTNKNYATGKSGGAIAANRIVGISASSGDVIQAVAATVPIGVSHNYTADAGQPITILPIGAGFARVTAGESLETADLGTAVGADAEGRVVKSYTHAVGILAGISADVEGATNAVAGDDVVVLLTNVVVGDETPTTKGTATFTVKDGAGEDVDDVTIALVKNGVTTSQETADGVAAFNVEAGTYTWTAVKTGYTILFDSGTVIVEAGVSTAINLLAQRIVVTEGTITFTAVDNVDNTTPISNTVVAVEVGDYILSGKTGVDGKLVFTLEVGAYDWEATPASGTAAPSTGTGTAVVAGEDTAITLKISL